MHFLVRLLMAAIATVNLVVFIFNAGQETPTEKVFLAVAGVSFVIYGTGLLLKYVLGPAVFVSAAMNLLVVIVTLCSVKTSPFTTYCANFLFAACVAALVFPKHTQNSGE